MSVAAFGGLSCASSLSAALVHNALGTPLALLCAHFACAFLPACLLSSVCGIWCCRRHGCCCCLLEGASRSWQLSGATWHLSRQLCRACGGPRQLLPAPTWQASLSPAAPAGHSLLLLSAGFSSLPAAVLGRASRHCSTPSAAAEGHLLPQVSLRPSRQQLTIVQRLHGCDVVHLIHPQE